MKIKLRYVLLLIGAAWFSLSTDDAAMAQCEKNHSHDTCFYSLNH